MRGITILSCNIQLCPIFLQLAEEQRITEELEASLEQKLREYEQQETQWQTEHEEEVRALRQRNSQLQGQLEDISIQYQEFIAEQEKQVLVFLNLLVRVVDQLCRLQPKGDRKFSRHNYMYAYCLYCCMRDFLTQNDVVATKWSCNISGTS